jgi:uncharacterized protein (DUF3084 family)
MQTTERAGAAHGPDRLRLKAEQIRAFQASLVVDPRRRRPLYFDGRFLAARDLVREQNYFLTRQSDLGRAGGFGVVEGLYVDRGGTPSSLSITAGHGVTPAGELVVLPSDFTVELTEIPEIQRLNAAFGLLSIPAEPPRNRTGLFVVALRPVEFSANPIASYPTQVSGPRTTEDGDIVEGAVITLIPYPDEGPDLSPALRRARVAHEVFVGGTAKGSAAGALPLAIVALNRGTVEWVDVFVVRREAGASQSDIIGLGFAPRALREAHLLQYEAHLREVLALRQGLGNRFAASEYFHALPPAGRLPAACVDAESFSQIWFPSTVDVDLSLVPEDEIPALVEESLSLQPIDLTRSAEELDSTAVVVMIPVPRRELRTLTSDISSLTRALKPAAPGMLARRQPLEHLRGLRLPGAFVQRTEVGDTEDAAWKRLLARGGMLWYARRRALHHRADLAGERQLLDALQEPTSDAEALAELGRQLEAKRAQLDERDLAVRGREEDIAEREERIDEEQEARDRELRARAERATARDAELTARDTLLRGLEATLTARDTEITRREALTATAQGELRTRELAVDKRLQEVRQRENDATTRETEVAERLAGVVSREGALANLDAALKQREKAASDLEKQNAQRSTALDTRHAQQETRQAQLNTLAGQLDARVLALNAREGSLNTRQSQQDQRQTEQNNRNAQLDQRQRDLDQRTAQLNTRSAQLDHRQAQQDQRQREQDQRNAQLSSRQHQLDVREADLERRERIRSNHWWKFEP